MTCERVCRHEPSNNIGCSSFRASTRAALPLQTRERKVPRVMSDRSLQLPVRRSLWHRAQAQRLLPPASTSACRLRRALPVASTLQRHHAKLLCRHSRSSSTSPTRASRFRFVELLAAVACRVVIGPVWLWFSGADVCFASAGRLGCR